MYPQQNGQQETWRKNGLQCLKNEVIKMRHLAQIHARFSAVLEDLCLLPELDE